MPSMKSENPILLRFPNALSCWVLSARPKTLIAGLSPVLLGAAIAARYAPLSWGIFTLCLLFSLTLQIGANWANDYFDFLKGADTPQRQGPTRAVQAGWIAPRVMKRAFILAFCSSALIALPLLNKIGFALTPLMCLCIVCAILYTGGKRPLGYLGLGELLVFVFYGPVAVCSTTLALLDRIPQEAWAFSLIPACFSCALLTINNLRDRTEDLRANKLTLIARFGVRFGKLELLFFLLTPFLFAWSYPALLFLCPLAFGPIVIACKETGQWNLALALTTLTFCCYTGLCCALL